MKILYLYTEVMAYTFATIKALVKCGVEVHLVHWDHKKLTPYLLPEWPNVYEYKRSLMTTEDIFYLAQELAPKITVVSGWQDKGYMFVARLLRARDRIVVAGFDDQWHGRFRQYFATTLGCLGYFTSYFSHAWVAGVYQYEYASRLGFTKKSIIFDLYSADIDLWGKAYQENLNRKEGFYPHRFLFVGRFDLIKGLDILLEAWQSLGQNRRDWELHLIGNGPLKSQLLLTPGVIVKDFKQPDYLVHEAEEAGCFILPSSSEPWGVVVHEFATAGMPMILSNVVGAASAFLISGLNGYSFKAGDSGDLAKRISLIINSSDKELQSMSVISNRLSARITPQTSAANLLSIVALRENE